MKKMIFAAALALLGTGSLSFGGYAVYFKNASDQPVKGAVHWGFDSEKGLYASDKSFKHDFGLVGKGETKFLVNAGDNTNLAISVEDEGGKSLTFMEDTSKHGKGGVCLYFNGKDVQGELWFSGNAKYMKESCEAYKGQKLGQKDPAHHW